MGQLLDQRVGYWSGEGLAFTPRAVPFIEDVPIAVRSLLAGLRLRSALSAASLHPSLAAASSAAAGGGRPAAHLTLLARGVCAARWASLRLGLAATVCMAAAVSQLSWFRCCRFAVAAHGRQARCGSPRLRIACGVDRGT